MNRYVLALLGVLLLVALPILGTLSSSSAQADQNVRLTSPVSQPITVRY